MQVLHESAWLIGPGDDGRRRNLLHVRLWEQRGDPRPWRVHVRTFETPARRTEGSFVDEDEAWARLDAVYALYTETEELRWSKSEWTRGGWSWGALRERRGRIADDNQPGGSR